MTQTAACPLCASAAPFHASARDIEYYTLPDSFDFHRCGACDVLFINPMRSDSLNVIYPTNYYSFKGQKPTLATRVKSWLDHKRFGAFLDGIPGERLSALDIGGGNGWLLSTLRAITPRLAYTQVVDLDPAAEAGARESGHDYHLGPVEGFATDKRFDVIMMLNIIEHVTDPRAVLKKAAGLLTPGGRILLQTPNFDALDARLFKNRSWGGYHTPRHFVLFTMPSLKTLAAEAGLRVVRARYVQGAPFWSVSVLDLLKRLGLVKISAERPAVYHPLIPFLQMGFAAFDMLRAPVSKLSQMEFELALTD